METSRGFCVSNPSTFAETLCPVDAKNGETRLSDGPESPPPELPAPLVDVLNHLACAMDQQNSLLMQLVDQNEVLIRNLVDEEEQDDAEPATDMAGNPITVTQ
jgi:hypothetical protein